MNWQEFFAMGGYGFYVWSSFGITAVCMIGACVHALRAESGIKRLIREEQAMQRWAAQEDAELKQAGSGET